MSILRKIYLFLIDIVQTLLIAAAVFLVIYVFIMRPFQVNGESMYPNFEDGEYVLTNLVGKRLSDPKRGDVIVFKAPMETDKDFIKRVVGLPGDRVMIKEGIVYVNGSKLDESSYLPESVKTFPGTFMKDSQEVEVPAGSLLALGDNRPYSSDSREWGFVPKKDIIGSSFFVYWPVSHAKRIQNPY